MSTRTCRAKASGHGDETMQLETQLTRRLRGMLATKRCLGERDLS